MFFTIAILPARLAEVVLQSRSHLVVREERYISRMRHSECLPIFQQCRPRMKEAREDIKLENRDVIVTRQIHCGLECGRLHTLRCDRMRRTETSAKLLPWNDESVSQMRYSRHFEEVLFPLVHVSTVGVAKTRKKWVMSRARKTLDLLTSYKKRNNTFVINIINIKSLAAAKTCQNCNNFTKDVLHVFHIIMILSLYHVLTNAFL